KDKTHQVMSLKGGGQIRAPKDKVLPKVLDPRAALKSVSFVKEIQVDDKNQSIFVRAEVYGFSNSMKIRWKIKKETEEESIVSYEVLAGLMKGFALDLSLEAVKNGRTDVGIDGIYKYLKFPMPAFF